jgi:hypothetical protein
MKGYYGDILMYFSYYVFEIWWVLFAQGTSSFRLASFQAFSNYTWLVSTMLFAKAVPKHP